MELALGAFLSCTQALDKSGFLFHCKMHHTLSRHHCTFSFQPWEIRLSSFYLGFFPFLFSKVAAAKLYFVTCFSNHGKSIKSLFHVSLSSHPRVCSWLLSFLCSTFVKLSLPFCLGLLFQLWTFPDSLVCGSNFPFTIHLIRSFHMFVIGIFPSYSLLDPQHLYTVHNQLRDPVWAWHASPEEQHNSGTVFPVSLLASHVCSQDCNFPFAKWR